MMTSDELIVWLKCHPLIKISALEKEAEIPITVISGALYGKNKIPVKYLPKLVKALKPYGLDVTTAHICE